jgi:hypothetical protein
MCPLCKGLLNDLHMFDPIELLWINLTARIFGVSPSPRELHGFTASGYQLYVYGGWDGKGTHDGFNL